MNFGFHHNFTSATKSTDYLYLYTDNIVEKFTNVS